MSELLNYIDDYFNGLLSPEEKTVFEERCEKEESFAGEVALYIAARETTRNELLAQKREAWKNLATAPVVSMAESKTKVFKMRPWYAVAAAACIIGILFLVLPLGENKPEQLASNYIQQQLQTLSVTMDGSHDSLQTAINEYNKKQYSEAQSILLDILSRNHELTDVIKYSGLTYLMQNKYEEAIEQFEQLAAAKDLFSNPGLFYKALTLLKRNTGTDKENAKKLLQEVVDKNLDGSKEATEWLKKWE